MISIKQLREYPLFANLGEPELADLIFCLSRRVIAKGVHLYYPGNPGLYTYLVESGLVRLYYTNPAGQEFILNLAGPREVFGLPFGREEDARVLGAVAHLPTVVLLIRRTDLFRLMERSPSIMHSVYQELSTSARKLMFQVRALTCLTLNGRLAILLLRMSMKDKNRAASNEVDLPLNQTELAGWVGASRGRLNRAVKELEQLGLIRVDGQKFILLNRAGLERLTLELSPEPL